MPIHRRVRGFERAGQFPADELALPRARSRELALAAAWARVAGEALARRAGALRVRAGVLEIGVEDERWLGTVRELIPRLAGRLAGAYPELGVRKVRVRRGERWETESEPVERPAPGAPAEAAGSSLPGPPAGAAGPADDGPVSGRLERAMERYLERVSDRSPSRPR